MKVDALKNAVHYLGKARFPVTLFLILLSVTPLPAQDVNIQAYLEETQVGINDQFVVNVEISGGDANDAPKPEAPDLSDFASYVGSGSSTSMSLINGKMSVSRTYQFNYVATRQGTFAIPAISIEHDGKQFTTDPIQIEIVQSRAPAPPRGQSQQSNPSGGNDTDLSKLLFLKADVDKRRVYQNEPVIVSYKIYTAVQVTNYGFSQVPNTVGFWSEDFEMPKRPRLYNEVLNGRQYRVAEIKRVALFPQQPGEKQLDPLVIECEVQMPRQRSRRDPFDSFFNDPFFGMNQTVRRQLASNVVTIDVMPLPESGKPTDFSGAVGDFTISAGTDKVSVKTNEAIAYKVTISGTGNIKIIPKPAMNFPRDFEVYEPKVTESIQRQNSKITGSKTFEYVLVPRFPGAQVLPQVRFSYFDPGNQRYKTVSSPSIELTVAKGDDQFVGSGPITSKEDVRFIGQDIRFIQMRMPEFQRRGNVFYKSAVFYAGLGIPLIAFLLALGYRRHQDKLSSNVAYARSRKANQMALRRLKRANYELGKGNPASFYSEVQSALMGFIGDKLNVPSAGLITDEVDNALRQRGIDDPIVDEYISCLHTCDFQRFAPSQSENGEMKEFFEKAKGAIISLDKVI